MRKVHRSRRTALQRAARQISRRGRMNGWDTARIAAAVLAELPEIRPLEAFRFACGWTRAQTIEAIADLYRHDGLAPPPINPSMVCRWEHGEINPGREYTQTLCRLYAASARELGLPDYGPALATAAPVEAERVPDPDDADTALLYPEGPEATVAASVNLWRREAATDRRVFLTMSFAAGAALAATVDWRITPVGASLAHHQGSRQVSAADVERAQLVLEEFQLLDSRHGGGYARSLLLTYLRDDLAPLLEGRYDHATGRELFASAAKLNSAAGWMLFDINAHQAAQAFYTQALSLARYAGDHHHGVFIQHNLATQALYLGRARMGARLARAARDAACPGCPQTIIARLCATEARAWAAIGDSHATRAALRVADSAIERADPAKDPAWLSVYTPAHHAGEVAHALRDLGRAREADRMIGSALDVPARNVRTTALHYVVAARIRSDHGQLDGACEMAAHALAALPALRSRRLVQRLTELNARFAGHRHIRVVADYLERSGHILRSVATS